MTGTCVAAFVANRLGSWRSLALLSGLGASRGQGNAYSNTTFEASLFQASPGATVCVGKDAVLWLSGAAVTSAVSCFCCWGAARANSGAAAKVMNVETRILLF